MTETKNDKNMSRRDFFGWGWAVMTGMASLSVFLLSALRMPLPSLMPGKSGKFKIGRKEDFPPGAAHYFEEQQTFVFADTEGIFAMSSLCTHLGCIVTREAEQFTCPCHGSKYDLFGKVKRGPAPRNLAWYQVEQLPGGRLVVNRNKVVNEGTKFLV
ncbi:MAG: ubiquinol-cytochrome c reductase iron-sulfur subunit [bacterium]